MTFTQLEIFALVAELRGFTAAALRLSISQSAVSHAIRALEQELGVSLVRRDPAGVELTDIGRDLLVQARQILGLAEGMAQQAAAARGLRRGTLRIGSFGPTSSLRLLPPLLAAFAEAHPGIEVYVEEGTDQQVLDGLLDRRVEIGFVVLPENRFDTLPLVEDQLVAVVPRGHPLAEQAALPLAALCDDPFILTAAGSAPLVSGVFAAARLSPRIRYRTGQLLSTLAQVEAGLGITLVAELALPAADAGRPAGYVARPLAPPVRREVGLALLDEAAASPAARAFLNIARRLQREGRFG
ncbi:LysR family transcriptional regulator [Metapseudomonas otitidis]|uniref:LysR family transcriptional regulator n=1 Tax=Metapseudomonas otitidis TaxID=319939 RepID=UPI00244AC303|nr:LysR family transcriptional regulator [Pseudomonas otitidis]MDG9783003.1 LysR family transcriptional regulator [Pseudomonas otitidis]